MVKLLCTQTIFQEHPKDQYYRQHYKFLDKYCKRRKEYHKFSHSWQCSWSWTFEVCKQAPYSFSLIAGISHHAAVTLLISLCISLNCTFYRLLDRGKKLTINKSLSPVSHHGPMRYSPHLRAQENLMESVVEMLLLVSPASHCSNPTCLQPHASCANSALLCPSAWSVKPNIWIILFHYLLLISPESSHKGSTW